MGNFTFQEAASFVLYIAGAVATVGGAIVMIARAVRTVKAPNANQDKRLAAAEQDIESIKGFLAQDKKRLDTLDEGTRVTQRALLALLGHGLDGNNQKQMREAKEALESHLINR